MLIDEMHKTKVIRIKGTPMDGLRVETALAEYDIGKTIQKGLR